MLLAVVVALTCGAGRAAAASVELAPSRLGSGLELTYLALAGEANHMTVLGPLDGSAWVGEAGAPLSAYDGCHLVAAGLPALLPAIVARCDYAHLTGAVVELGDGDDTATVGLPLPVELVGGTGGDRLQGGEGDDTLFGEAGGDELDGGAGDDLLEPGAGSDVVAGGTGSDTVDYYDRATPLSIDLEGDPDDGEAGEGDQVGADVENVIGGRSGDTIRGSAADNVLDGEAGADSVAGGDGDDLLLGGGGRDTVRGEGGADRLQGGPDADDMAGDGGDDALAGGAAADILAGGDGADELAGGAGADTLAGGGGADVLDGGEGTDALAGGEGADVLRSVDSGADSVECGEGVDRAEADTSDLVAADCEVVVRSAPTTMPGAPEPPEAPVTAGRPRHESPRSVTQATASEAASAEAGAGFAEPAPEPALPAAAPPVTPARDLAAPTVAISAARRSRGRVAVALDCSEPCTVTADLLLTPRQARSVGLRSRRLARGRARGAQRARFLLRVPRRARGLRATLSVRAVDAAGNRRSVVRSVKL